MWDYTDSASVSEVFHLNFYLPEWELVIGHGVGARVRVVHAAMLPPPSHRPMSLHKGREASFELIHLRWSCDLNCHVRILSSPLFLNRPHCAVGPSHESDWAEPLGCVDTLGDAGLLVFRTCVLKHQQPIQQA